MQLRNNFGAPVNERPTPLLPNGSFETGASGWFESSNPYEAIYDGDSSSGNRSAGWTTTSLASVSNPATWADWQSAAFSLAPGDAIVWSFSYKTSPATIGEALAELRGFSDASLSTFVQEDAMQLGGTDGQWRRVTRRFVVPAGVTAMDLRFNNIFTNVLDPSPPNRRLRDSSGWAPCL